MDDILLCIMSTPEYTRCVGYDQNNPHHHLTLDLHMQETAKNVERLVDGDEELILAAAIHDIGKPDVAFFDKKIGCKRFFGHANKSAEIANRLLQENGVSKEKAEIICWFIRHHDDFMSFRMSNVDEDHPFMRRVTPENVAEVILKEMVAVEGKASDINATVRVLVTGKKPSCGKVLPFRSATKPVKGLKDYQRLLILCKADAMAQSPNSVRPTQQEKLDTYTSIFDLLPKAYEIATEAVSHRV